MKTTATDPNARDTLHGLKNELIEAIEDIGNFSHLELLGLLLHCTDVLSAVLGESPEGDNRTRTPDHITALGYCWCNGLPCDATTLVALQRIAARISAQKGVPMGYEDNPDFSGEGITFRHDILRAAARELNLQPSAN